MVLALLGCSSLTPTDLVEDSSWPYRPELMQVSLSCDAGVATARARTQGWSNGGTVDVWGPDMVVVESWDMKSVGFSRDETCDIVEASWGSSDAGEVGAFTCDQYAGGTLTWMIRIAYESGCAGIHVAGPGAEAVEAGDVEAPLADLADDCDPPSEYSADTRPAAGEHVDAVTPCTEPLP